jgi:glycosyltransferase involved in cell wall biosynthesis
LRILLVVHHHLDQHSGAAGSVLSLRDEYRVAGHDVELVSFEDLSSSLPPSLLAPLFAPLVAQHIWRARRRYDIVDAATGDAWLWARLSSMLRLRGPVLVTRSHGLEHLVHEQRLVDRQALRRGLSWRYPLYHGGLRLWEVAESLRRADMTFFLNHAELQYAISELRVPRGSAHVVHNGISADLVARAQASSPTDTHKEGIGVVLLGTFIARKGIAYSLPALDRLLQSHPRSRVLLLGTGRPASEILPGFSEEVRDRIEVVERYSHEDLPALLAGYRIAVLASVAEGFGKSLLEAMACGLAPVATDVSGPAEFISHDVNGLLVRPRDGTALLGAIDALVTDPQRRERTSLAARRTAGRFGWDRVAADRLNLYKRVLA